MVESQGSSGDHSKDLFISLTESSGKRRWLEQRPRNAVLGPHSHDQQRRRAGGQQLQGSEGASVGKSGTDLPQLLPTQQALHSHSPWRPWRSGTETTIGSSVELGTLLTLVFP